MKGKLIMRIIEKAPMNEVDFENVKVTDSFWRLKIKTINDVTLEACLKRCEETGRISNFLKAAGTLKGNHEGMYFNDSDLYKVLEGIAYSLTNYPNPKLEEYADEIIRIISNAQDMDGYLNTYFQLSKVESKWTDMERHEDYNLGHMIEAAIAYKYSTGKSEFLEVACRAVDNFNSVVGSKEGKKHWVTGHQEIELALIKLYKVTNKEEYLKLSEWLLEERGHGYGIGDNLWGALKWGPKYAQDEKPIREMTHISGHAVRAMYMYTAMTDITVIRGEAEYEVALNKLWDNVINKNMYVTGGIGSSKENEGFTEDYDLPNASAYCETCASAGMVFWNHRMNLLHGDGKYADIVELELYNGVLAGISFYGDKFFYVNPLEADGLHHRVEWFNVSCCPTQLSRIIPSIGNYVYVTSEEGIYINLFIESTSSIKFNQNEIIINQKTQYPWEGEVSLIVNPVNEMDFEINLRYPGWCREIILSINGIEERNLYIEKGYIKILRKWKKGDEIKLILNMPVEKIVAHPKVKGNLNKVALKRGPLVYCIEEIDNKYNSQNLWISEDDCFSSEFKPELLGGICEVTVIDPQGKSKIKAIPYYAWDNREAGYMRVWLPKDKISHIPNSGSDELTQQ
jgi:uncharacterized protein